MGVEIVTKEDLQVLRAQLIADMRELLGGKQSSDRKQWLKNSDIKKEFGISSSTIQRLRISGQLKATMLGARPYYKLQDIERLLEAGLK